MVPQQVLVHRLQVHLLVDQLIALSFTSTAQPMFSTYETSPTPFVSLLLDYLWSPAFIFLVVSSSDDV